MDELPIFFSVKLDGEEELPIVVPLNASLVADCESSVPTPVRLTTCGLPAALSTKVRVPFWTPAEVGVKVILMLQLVRTATLPPQRLAALKGPVVDTESIVILVVEEGLVNWTA